MRLALALGRRGLVERDERGRYRPGMALVALGLGVPEHEPVVGAAEPVLERTAADVGETVFLAAARAGRLRVLDFQDARLGCRAYDLSSLLRDSYVTLPEEVFEGLFASYLARWAEASGRPEDPEAFRVLFDHMALQRNLKAVGTFASQWRLYGRDYRRYIAPTLAYVRANLAKYDDLARLRGLLSEYLEEVA